LIISRTPFRLSLGGGGTDLPSYYLNHGGFFISGAVDKYVHIAVNPRFEEDSIRVSYSETEIVKDANELKHPLVRESLDVVGIERGLEIVSVADAPAATGLGSSGSFCVGLLRALHAYLREEKTSQYVAEEACNISMNRLKEPSGKQDEYVAAFGGIRAYDIDRDGEVKVESVPLSTNSLAELEANILMFYTGITRSSSTVLSKQKTAIEKEGAAEKMDKIKSIGLKVRDALTSGNLTKFGELLDEHWKVKRGVVSAMSNDRIDNWYRVAKQNGAIGAKIVGAGGGGFLMLYCEDKRAKLRKAMAEQGLVEHRFRFDFEGSKVIYNV
jgi:D-glycero-alpha-D-manno-heptose-7-phosphate kinase